MFSIKYLNFFINEVLQKNKNINELDVMTFKKKFVENQSSLNIWIWLAHVLEKNILLGNDFDLKKCIDEFNFLEIINLPLNLQNKHPLLIHQGTIEIPTKKLNEKDLCSLNELLDYENWNIMQKAEMILSMNGHKVSRTSLSYIELIKLSKQLKGKLIISSELHTANNDNKIEGFSNTISESFELLNNSDNSQVLKGEVFIYFSKYFQDAYLASILDKYNMAGTLLEIPECCIESFKERWGISSMLYDGDLAYMNYVDDFNNVEQKIIEQPWQTNIYSMYLKGGLIWHFPCSKNCKKTIEIVNQRVKLLEKYDYNLSNKLFLNQNQAFFLDKSRQISWEKISDNNLYITLY